MRVKADTMVLDRWGMIHDDMLADVQLFVESVVIDEPEVTVEELNTWSADPDYYANPEHADEFEVVA